jgi:UTP-glucose-1-phosphate uridylyltransferase
MNPTLLILAAGMGRRYGGPKQIDRFGPSGETIMDYALYDALAAGFAKVVFVIRHDFESDFRAVVGGKYENRVSVDYVFQELDDLPPGFTVPSGRTQPWGTAHAIWCARRCVQEPFVSVNADDYYGRSAFRAVAQHLMRPAVENPERLPEYCVVGYPVLQTLSAHGAVARAICEVDEEGFLKALVERTHVERSGDTGRYVAEAGRVCVLQGNEVVSMNMWGFSPTVFDQLDRHLTRFLEVQTRTRDTSEYVIPVALNEILAEKAARVRVLPTSDAWFGVTHAKDRLGAIESIREMVKRGEYPSPIWSCG